MMQYSIIYNIISTVINTQARKTRLVPVCSHPRHRNTYLNGGTPASKQWWSSWHQSPPLDPFLQPVSYTLPTTGYRIPGPTARGPPLTSSQGVLCGVYKTLDLGVAGPSSFLAERTPECGGEGSRLSRIYVYTEVRRRATEVSDGSSKLMLFSLLLLLQNQAS